MPVIVLNMYYKSAFREREFWRKSASFRMASGWPPQSFRIVTEGSWFNIANARLHRLSGGRFVYARSHTHPTGRIAGATETM